MTFGAVFLAMKALAHIPTGPTVCASVWGALAGVPWVYGQLPVLFFHAACKYGCKSLGTMLWLKHEQSYYEYT